MANRTPTDLLAHALLQLMAANIFFRPRIRKLLKEREGWANFTVGFRTENDTVRESISFENGYARVSMNIPDAVDTTLCFKNDDIVMKMLKLPPNEVLNLLLRNEMSITGNLATMNRFNFLLSILLEEQHKKLLEQRKKEDLEKVMSDRSPADAAGAEKLAGRRREMLRGERSDAVEFIDDPYLSQYSLADFPRLKKFLDIHINTKPEICHERAKLLTDWFRVHGFENHRDGTPWVPELRQAHAYKFMMENREPIIRGDDLIAGTTTTREIGVVLYPDSSGTLIWGELKSVGNRQLNPYDISDATVKILNEDVFPYWERRNIREWTRKEYGAPLCQKIDERFAAYFMWKTVALSHTIADFPKMLHIGTGGMIEEIRAELEKNNDPEKDNLLRAMILTLEGVNEYAENLRKRAAGDAEKENNPRRKAELLRLSEILGRVPKAPALTLDEAVNAVWVGWVGLHMENTNAGLSLGRMDQWLQP
ncbi:MAG: pyruvate formate lyase family protein, partial [bacterium]